MATEAIQGKPSTTSEAASTDATLQKPWNLNIAMENLFECSPTVLEAIASGKVQEATEGERLAAQELFNQWKQSQDPLSNF